MGSIRVDSACKLGLGLCSVFMSLLCYSSLIVMELCISCHDML
jgi:hypothetical protein